MPVKWENTIPCPAQLLSVGAELPALGSRGHSCAGSSGSQCWDVEAEPWGPGTVPGSAGGTGCPWLSCHVQTLAGSINTHQPST